MTKIKPALTAEEWEEFRANQAIASTEIEWKAQSEGDFHGAAALALYGQPFGFTRDMLLALQTILERHVDADRGPAGQGWQSGELLQMIEFAKAAADRIEALLPPEG